MCYFKEYKYFSKVIEYVREDNTENGIFTEIHYLKFVFRIRRQCDI